MKNGLLLALTALALAALTIALLRGITTSPPEVRAEAPRAVDESSRPHDERASLVAENANEMNDRLIARLIDDQPFAEFERARGQTIDVVVTRDRVPLAGVPVRISANGGEQDAAANLERLFESWEPASVQHTDGAGRARLPWIEGGDCTAYARPAHDSTWLVEIEREGNERAKTVEIALGTARVSGHVYRRDGSPARRAAVFALGARAGVMQCTTTDASGFYVLPDMPSGFASIAATTATFVDAAPLGERVVELADGDIVTVDIGAQDLVRWRGIVRLANGTVLSGPGEIELVSATDVAENDANEVRTLVAFDLGGRIDTEFPPGRYIVQRVGRQPARSAVLEIESGSSDHDVVLRGSSIRGAVRYVGKSATRKREAARYATLELASDGPGLPTVAPCVRADDAYAFCGLARGNYRVRSSPWPIAGAPREGLLVSISSDAADIALDIAVTDP